RILGEGIILNLPVITGLVPVIPLRRARYVPKRGGPHLRAYTPVCDGLCPAMTKKRAMTHPKVTARDKPTPAPAAGSSRSTPTLPPARSPRSLEFAGTSHKSNTLKR